MTVVAQAPAKLVLFGEYAVLEDAPAIVAAVDRCATVRIERRGETSVDSDLGTEAGVAWLDAWAAAARRDVDGLHVELRTEDLFANGRAKLGIGSSAALAVAMSAALRSVAGEALEKGEALAADLETHHRLQGGAGSGIDVAASFHGGVIAWWRDRRVERLAWPDDLHFACVWTGSSASTRAMLDRVRAFERKEPAAYAQCIERMRAVSRSALDAFRDGRSPEIVALAAAYHEAMDDLGTSAGVPIVSAAHAALAALAGGTDVTYKPSGAGGGDVGLLFSASRQALDEAVERCLTNDYHVLSVQIRSQGVTVSKGE